MKPSQLFSLSGAPDARFSPAIEKTNDCRIKPSQFLFRPAAKKSLLVLFCLLSVTAGVFAGKDITISEKLLQTFKQTFPNAEQVKWLELSDKYTVNFKENGILTKVDYDRDGNFISSVRYYFEKNLPVNIICKLQKRFADKKVFGVTEMTTETTVEYYIKLEDATTWITVKSNIDGNMEVVEKYKKAL